MADTKDKKQKIEEKKIEHVGEIHSEANKEEIKLQQEKKTIEKKEQNKTESLKQEKKEEAIAMGNGLHASKKQCMYICNFIKNKPIDRSINYLEEVIKFKRSIPFKGEIPHRKEKGIMSGRYPINAAKLFIKLLKGLRGSVLVNNLNLENTRIVIASASWAHRPMRSEGRAAKRTNVILKAKEVYNGD